MSTTEGIEGIHDRIIIPKELKRKEKELENLEKELKKEKKMSEFGNFLNESKKLYDKSTKKAKDYVEEIKKRIENVGVLGIIGIPPTIEELKTNYNIIVTIGELEDKYTAEQKIKAAAPFISYFIKGTPRSFLRSVAIYGFLVILGVFGIEMSLFLIKKITELSDYLDELAIEKMIKHNEKTKEKANIIITNQY